MTKRYPEWVNTSVIVKAIKMREKGILHVISEDQLQYISSLTPHAILSMIKEIRSA